MLDLCICWIFVYVGSVEYSMHLSNYDPKYAFLQYIFTFLFFHSIHFVEKRKRFFVQTCSKFKSKKNSIKNIAVAILLNQRVFSMSLERDWPNSNLGSMLIKPKSRLKIEMLTSELPCFERSSDGFILIKTDVSQSHIL